jgi:hypothetical protein
MGKLNPCRLGAGEMKQVLEVLVHHIDHPVAKGPQKEERRNKGKSNGVAFPFG